MKYLEMEHSKTVHYFQKDFENPFQLKELIEKFKGLNPKYDVSNLTVIDSIEEYNMKYVVGKLNGR